MGHHHVRYLTTLGAGYTVNQGVVAQWVPLTMLVQTSRHVDLVAGSVGVLWKGVDSACSTLTAGLLRAMPAKGPSDTASAPAITATDQPPACFALPHPVS